MSDDLLVQNEPNVYLLPIRSVSTDEAGADTLIFSGDLTDVLAGSVVVLNRRYYTSKPTAIVSASYDAPYDRTVARLAAGTCGDVVYRWVAVVTAVVSELAQEETDAMSNPSLLSRFVSWLGF